MWCTNSELTIILCSLHGCLLWSLCWDMWTLLLQGGSRFVLFSDQLVWGFIKWNLVPRSKFATRGFQMARRRKISWLCNKLHPSVQCMCLFSTLYFSCICCAMLSKYIDSILIHVIKGIKKSWENYNIGLKHVNLRESGSHLAIIILFHFRWSEISNCLLKGSVISRELPKRGRVPEELLKKGIREENIPNSTSVLRLYISQIGNLRLLNILDILEILGFMNILVTCKIAFQQGFVFLHFIWGRFLLWL